MIATDKIDHDILFWEWSPSWIWALTTTLVQLLLKRMKFHIQTLGLHEYYQVPDMLLEIWRNNTFVEAPHDEIVVTEEYDERSIASHFPCVVIRPDPRSVRYH